MLSSLFAVKADASLKVSIHYEHANPKFMTTKFAQILNKHGRCIFGLESQPNNSFSIQSCLGIHIFQSPFFSIKFSICVYDLYMLIFSVFLLLIFIATDVSLILLEVQMNGEQNRMKMIQSLTRVWKSFKWTRLGLRKYVFW